MDLSIPSAAYGLIGALAGAGIASLTATRLRRSTRNDDSRDAGRVVARAYLGELRVLRDAIADAIAHERFMPDPSDHGVGPFAPVEFWRHNLDHLASIDYSDWSEITRFSHDIAHTLKTLEFLRRGGTWDARAASEHEHALGLLDVAIAVLTPLAK